MGLMGHLGQRGMSLQTPSHFLKLGDEQSRESDEDQNGRNALSEGRPRGI